MYGGGELGSVGVPQPVHQGAADGVVLRAGACERPLDPRLHRVAGDAFARRVRRREGSRPTTGFRPLPPLDFFSGRVCNTQPWQGAKRQQPKPIGVQRTGNPAYSIPSYSG